MPFMATFALKAELNDLRVLDIAHNLWLSQSVVSSSCRSAHRLRKIFASNTITPFKKILWSLVPWSPWSPWSSSFQVATVSVTQKAIAGRQRMLIHVSPSPAHKRLYKAEEGAARLVEVCDERVNRTN